MRVTRSRDLEAYRPEKGVASGSGNLCVYLESDLAPFAALTLVDTIFLLPEDAQGPNTKRENCGELIYSKSRKHWVHSIFTMIIAAAAAIPPPSLVLLEIQEIKPTRFSSFQK